jgi:glycerophosphoryl diester phosphodiesterase
MTGTSWRDRARADNNCPTPQLGCLIINGHTQVLVSGHRGDCQNTPEQTMAAFTEAVRAGADAIEFDVQWTKDQQMVLMHDWTVDRTTSATGLVSELTFEEIRACDAGSWFSAEFAGAYVPTLEEVLGLAAEHSRLLINAEVKNPALTSTQACALRDAIASAGVADRTIVSSFDHTALAVFRAVDPDIKIASALVDYGAPGAVAEKTPFGGTYYMPRWWGLTRGRIQEFQAAGVNVWVWPAMTEQDFEAACALEPDAIVVDSVSAFRRWYAANGDGSGQRVDDGGHNRRYDSEEQEGRQETGHQR